MVKTVSKKKSVRKKSPAKSKDSDSKSNVDKMLLQNFVSLQRVMVGLSVKFDELSTQISKLLSLFELSAKTLASKDLNFGGREDNKELMKKIDNLLDQNKTIARGLALMYEGTLGKGQPEPVMQNPEPRPTQFAPAMAKPLGVREGNYQKSISTKEENDETSS